MAGISKKPVPRVETLERRIGASVPMVALVAAMALGITEAKSGDEWRNGAGERQAAQAPRRCALTIPAKPRLSVPTDPVDELCCSFQDNF